MAKKKQRHQNCWEVLDEINAVIESGINPVRRTIYLVGDVDSAMVGRFMASFHHLDRTEGPIEVRLCTAGGNGEEALAIYDAVRSSNNDVLVVGTGRVNSAGVVILQAGDLRLLTPNTTFMVHDSSIKLGRSSVSQIGSCLSGLRMVDGMFNKILAERSGHTLMEIERLSKEETFLSAEDAVKWNFADNVLENAR